MNEVIKKILDECKLNLVMLMIFPKISAFTNITTKCVVQSYNIIKEKQNIYIRLVLLSFFFGFIEVYVNAILNKLNKLTTKNRSNNITDE